MISGGGDCEGRGWAGAWIGKSEELKKEWGKERKKKWEGEGETELKRERANGKKKEIEKKKTNII